MCGIIGAVCDQNVVTTLLQGLSRLEYRGYDSAGIAVIDDKDHLKRLRTTGKIRELEQKLHKTPLFGNIGIAHTRWATHGIPNEKNAHPHVAGNKIAIVHNGIIENYQSIHAELLAKNCVLESDTDSELIAHLIYLKVSAGENLLLAVQNTVKQLDGTFALAVMSSDEPEVLIALRKGSPLVIGLAEHGNYIASDGLSILPITNKFIYLEEGDIAQVGKSEILIHDQSGKIAERKTHIRERTNEISNKGDYAHFMLKEIFEQPQALTAALEGRTTQNKVLSAAFGINADTILSQTKRVQIVACGTSFHAALVAKYWIEDLAKIPCQVEIASEFRYRQKIVEPNTLFVTLSQSGETADTLAALRLANKDNYLASLAICNVPDSSIVRESDLVLMMNAGQEIGVASTKAFTSQLVCLFLLTLALGSHHGLSVEQHAELLEQLEEIPNLISEALELNHPIKEMARKFTKVNHTLFLGRGNEFPIALEGALKLKEISYIHAEAYPAGELKHGPLALVDADMPVVALAPDDSLIEKLKSNLEEVRARGGKLFVFAGANANIKKDAQTTVLMMPNVPPYLAPIVYAVPMQLLAYHVAALKGTDVDQPRNLAKSVTVE